MPGDWYPTRLADLPPWEANFGTQVAATGATYGLSVGDQTDVANDKINAPLLVNYKEAVDAYRQAVTEYVDIILNAPIGTPMPPAPAAPAAPTLAIGSKTAMKARTRGYAGIVKADPDYTLEVGELYGIIAPAPGALQDPSIRKLAPVPGSSDMIVSLSKGSYDLIAIDMRRGGGEFVQVGVSQTATFVDETPPLVAGQPETREYRCQGMEANARVGNLSATVSAVTTP